MSASWRVPATVVLVHDGDTLICDLDLGWHITLRQHVRLLGINAPETRTVEGKAARTFLRELVHPGDRVTVVSRRLLGQTEKYGRVLAAVELIDPEADQAPDLSTIMLRAGHAIPYMV